MKIRNGFVSNSSSSSFIVASKKGSKVKLTLEVDLAEYGDKIETIEQLNEYFITERYQKNIEDMISKDGYEAERYNKCVKAIKEDKVVLLGSFSSDGGALDQFLCEHGISDLCQGDIELIDGGEGGYK